MTTAHRPGSAAAHGIATRRGRKMKSRARGVATMPYDGPLQPLVRRFGTTPIRNLAQRSTGQSL